MSKEYVTKNGAYRIGDTRVSLDSIVCSWLQGDSPETIVDNLPSVTLEQEYGAIAFYLANPDEIDEYLRQGDAGFERLSREWRANHPLLYQKLAAYKQQKRERVA